MHRLLFAPLLLALSVGEALADGVGGKLSPYVRQAAAGPSASRRVGASGGRAMLTAFVLLDGEEGGSALEANGCRVYDRRGDIAIAAIPRRSILTLASSPAIRRIEASASCRLTMDTTAVVSDIRPAWQGASLPQAFTGEGVVVGVMDVGFDLTHPTFRSADLSTYRIKALWDQLSTDTVGSAFPVGRDYVGEQELLGVQHCADGLIQTHGTHTAGIAAGSGYDSPYCGVAYGSDLCLVANAVTSDISLIDSTDLYKYTTATDALGFKYIFDYAEAQGKPCVASFSEGYTPDYMEEDSLFSAYLASLVGPGRIIVSSTGNESRADVGTYVAKPRGVAEAGAFLSGQKTVGMIVRGEGDYGVTLRSHATEGSDSLVLPVEAQPLDSAFTYPYVAASGDTLCTVTALRYTPSLADRTPLCYLTLATSTTIAARRLAFTLTGEGAEACAYSCSGAGLFYNAGQLDPRCVAAESSHNVLAPSCFPSVIAVGATTHRAVWANYEGTDKTSAQDVADQGRLAFYSSCGPAIDGGMKPDVTAPGSNVVSAYSSFYEEHNPTANDLKSDVARFVYGGRTYAWNSNAGTSMACPVVAGVVALWLQADPTLSPDDVRGVFSRTSRQLDPSLAYPNNRYGHGDVDAYRGLLDVLGLSGVEGLSDSQPRQLRIGVEDGSLRLHLVGDCAGPLRVTVYTVGGVKVYDGSVDTRGRADVTLDVPSLQCGVYAVQVAAADSRYAGSGLVRIN